MKYCINCGSEIQDEPEICPECGVNQGTRLGGAHGDRGANQRYCVGCGRLINRQAELCPECGVRQPGPRGARSSSQVAAGVLALLLGGIGAHKFYQGNIKNGILYLCFFWTGIPAILGIIEGVLMLVADEQEYEEKWATGTVLGR